MSRLVSRCTLDCIAYCAVTLELHVQAETGDMAEREEAVQKWQRAAHKAQRHADACYAEANAKDEEAAEATAQVVMLVHDNATFWDVSKVPYHRATGEAFIVALLMHTLTLIRFCFDKQLLQKTSAVNAMLLCHNQSSRLGLQLLRNCMSCSH